MRGAGEGGGTVGGGGELQASQGQSLSQGQNAQTVWGGVARMGKLPPAWPPPSNCRDRGRSLGQDREPWEGKEHWIRSQEQGFQSSIHSLCNFKQVT